MALDGGGLGTGVPAGMPRPFQNEHGRETVVPGLAGTA